MTTSFTKLSIVVALIILSSQAFSADGAEVYIAKACAACHGTDANTPIMPIYPKLAGQNAEYLAQQLQDIKSGARNNGQSIIMKGIMAGVSDEEIAVLSTYISEIKPEAKPETKTEEKTEEKKKE